MTWEEAQAIALKLPGAEPGSYHGYPAVRVKGRFLMRRGDDPDTLEFKGFDPAERDLFTAAHPNVLVVPERYRGTAMMLARLPVLDVDLLNDLLERRWRAIAPRSLQATPPPPAGTRP